jgi:uncharacterized tellurite resistance protein B-like protein
MNTKSRGKFNDIIEKYLNKENFDAKGTEENDVQVIDKDAEFAVALILVELASSDQNFDQEEYHIIYMALQTLFGCDRAKSRNLINRALLTLKQLRGTVPYVELLRDVLSDFQKENFIDILKEMMTADGVIDPFEVYHLNRIVSIISTKN